MDGSPGRMTASESHGTSKKVSRAMGERTFQIIVIDPREM